jgi:hypothetical protein
LPLANLAVSFYNVGLIWLTQVVCYPLWAYVGRDQFYAYHGAWWHGIWGVCFVPAGLAVLGAVAMLWVRPPEVPAWQAWVGVALQAATWILTAVWWRRWMAELVAVSGPVYGELYHKILTTHWLRVALVTAYGLLMFRMAAESFSSSSARPTFVSGQMRKA